jgi:hypothetical protein
MAQNEHRGHFFLFSHFVPIVLAPRPNACGPTIARTSNRLTLRTLPPPLFHALMQVKSNFSPIFGSRAVSRALCPPLASSFFHPSPCIFHAPRPRTIESTQTSNHYIA